MSDYTYRRADTSDLDALIAVRMDFLRMVGIITSQEQECKLHLPNLDFLKDNLPSETTSI